MTLNSMQTKKLLEHGGAITFSQWSLSVLITKLKGTYKSDPKALDSCMNELNAYFTKYSTIAQNDYNLIVKL